MPAGLGRPHRLVLPRVTRDSPAAPTSPRPSSRQTGLPACEPRRARRHHPQSERGSRWPHVSGSPPLLSAPNGPATSPVPSGRHEVHTAVYPGVRDATLAGDEDLLLQVLLVLFIDVVQDGVPARVGDGPNSGSCPGAPPASLGPLGWSTLSVTNCLGSPGMQDIHSCTN